MNTQRRLTFLTRVGFATRGLLYIVIATLILQTGRTEDTAGALTYLGHGGGRILLGAMALGLVGYGLWRLSDAAFNIERHSADKSGTMERVGAGISGTTHLVLAWQAIRLMEGAASVGGDSAKSGAKTALAMPGGWILLLIVAAALLIVGGVQGMKAVKASYLKHLEPAIARRPWAKWSGRAGYAARALVFLICGIFVAQAGLVERASEAGGMRDALRWLDNPWDMVVAVGLLGFGLFSLIEARYRILADVPVDRALRSAARLA